MVLMVVSQMQVLLYLEVPMVCLDCIIGCTHYADALALTCSDTGNVRNLES